MSETSFACSRLGRVAQHMLDTSERIGHDPMLRVAEICLRRGRDPDEEVQALIRHILLQHAHINHIDVMSMPLVYAN